MLEELQAKPSREKTRREADKAADRAYGRAYRQATMDAAKAEGAAAGMADATGGMDVPTSAIEAARQRALGGGQSAPIPAVGRPPTESAAPSTGVQTVRLPDGTQVPEQYYDLAPGDQRRMLQLIKEREKRKADDSVALASVNQMLDLRDRDAARLKALETRIAEQDRMIATLATALEVQSNAIEVNKSEALLEQQAGIGKDVANLSAIRAEAAAEMAEYNRLREVAAAENRAGLEATATAVDSLRGSVKSSTTLMSERSAAIEQKLTAGESRQQKLDVAIQELEGKTDAWTDPITRAEVNTMATEAVAEQWREQLPALTEAVAQTMLEMYPGGVGGQKADLDYVRRQRTDAMNYQYPVS